MMAFNAELTKAGAMITGEGLRQSAKGARIHFSDSEPQVQDGPFALENLVSGLWIVKLDSFEDAVSWARKIPFTHGSVEIRQTYGPEDFGDSLTDDLKAQEAELRKRSEGSNN